MSTASALVRRLREVVLESLPLPAGGQTAERHRRLLELGREDLSLARLAEAHFDAVAILAEAGREPRPGAVYGVWASEAPGRSLSCVQAGGEFLIRGTKMFCSGAGIVDRALVTVLEPQPCLMDLDLRTNAKLLQVDETVWKTKAFSQTRTATIVFGDLPAAFDETIGDTGWYLSRPGFWHGACGPAACWAGGAIGLVDYAQKQSRSDPHTLAHLGALYALAWQLRSYLEIVGCEIDLNTQDADAARIRALTLRHSIEQASTEILRRFARAYGPAPLAFDEVISNRYQELEVYLRQCHGERDLEALGDAIRIR